MKFNKNYRNIIEMKIRAECNKYIKEYYEETEIKR